MMQHDTKARIIRECAICGSKGSIHHHLIWTFHPNMKFAGATFAIDADDQGNIVAKSSFTMASEPPPGHFSILYFAAASSFTKKSSEDLKAPLELKDLFSYLEGRYPGFQKAVLCSCAVTVNLNYVDMEELGDPGDGKAPLKIVEGDEVALIPPVSSG